MSGMRALVVLGLLLCQGLWGWAQRRPVEARNGMVVSAHRLASEAGVEILKRGGNAVDAAVAVGFALAVVYPEAGNLGGGGFMVIRFRDGAVYTLDYRETAPLKAHRDMYLDERGEYISEKSKIGHLAVGVPGSVAGLLEAHERFGRLPRAVVMEPAIRLAEEGFTLSRIAAENLNEAAPYFRRFAGSRKYFLHPDGRPWQEGDRLVQRDLAETLKRIRDRGREDFYRGKTADLLVAEMRRGGGLITHEDLARYRPLWREPVRGTYRGYEIISMGPPSSGGVALLQLLNMVEPYDLKAMGFLSSGTIHLMAEAMRRVYADRAEFLGDPDFYPVPVSQLISKAYAHDRMRDFDPERVTPSAQVRHGQPHRYESEQTTHYSIVDAEGNAVACTTTLNGGYGSYVAVEGAGFLLNNEMDDFSAKPGVPNMFGLIGGEANAIAPGKRMLSSMTPTIVTRDGRLFLVIGTPGGATIITTVFQILVNVIDFGLNIQEAIDAPRFHHQWLPDVLFYEKRGLPRDVLENLRRRGWELRERPGYSGRADGILVGPDGRLYGGADPRGEDTAIGY
ncbi:MAG: gamma-glutamyltransferase [Bacteroidota bacterium]|nr:gamma-glutamyltransferase [Rhodothermia bacterium]MCS7154268.1 gamma-glutamyltransferase [Bacteroidota bacterium]MDW8137024.1 gamma-glutamyltransferase [Bacteroidota bacterium]MDW8285105.1 gamma-glutamyltransferase [Bacteroidota bacterium]